MIYEGSLSSHIDWFKIILCWQVVSKTYSKTKLFQTIFNQLKNIACGFHPKKVPNGTLIYSDPQPSLLNAPGGTVQLSVNTGR